MKNSWHKDANWLPFLLLSRRPTVTAARAGALLWKSFIKSGVGEPKDVEPAANCCSGKKKGFIFSSLPYPLFFVDSNTFIWQIYTPEVIIGWIPLRNTVKVLWTDNSILCHAHRIRTPASQPENSENQGTGSVLVTDSGSKSWNGGTGRKTRILLTATMRDNTVLRMSKIHYLVNIFHAFLSQ